MDDDASGLICVRVCVVLRAAPAPAVSLVLVWDDGSSLSGTPSEGPGSAPGLHWERRLSIAWIGKGASRVWQTPRLSLPGGHVLAVLQASQAEAVPGTGPYAPVHALLCRLLATTVAPAREAVAPPLPHTLGDSVTAEVRGTAVAASARLVREVPLLFTVRPLKLHPDCVVFEFAGGSPVVPVRVAGLPPGTSVRLACRWLDGVVPGVAGVRVTGPSFFADADVARGPDGLASNRWELWLAPDDPDEDVGGGNASSSDQTPPTHLPPRRIVCIQLFGKKSCPKFPP